MEVVGHTIYLAFDLLIAQYTHTHAHTHAHTYAHTYAHMHTHTHAHTKTHTLWDVLLATFSIEHF